MEKDQTEGGGEARLFWVFFSSPSLRYLCVVIFTWIISQCDWISTCSLWGSCSRMQCCQFPDHRGCEYNHKLEQISWNDRNGRDDWFVDLWIVQNGFFCFLTVQYRITYSEARERSEWLDLDAVKFAHTGFTANNNIILLKLKTCNFSQSLLAGTGVTTSQSQTWKISVFGKS